VSTSTLFCVTVAIWGTTWFAIKYQLDAMAPEVGVALRFFVAAAVVTGWCLARGKSLRLSGASHVWLALQGALGFSLAYIFVYHAERFIVSGLVAVGYAAAPLVNMALSRWLFGTPMAARVAAGGGLGLAGIVLVFWPTFEPMLAGGATDAAVTLGAALTVAAVLLSCLTNLITLRMQRRGVTGWPPIGIAMGYGAACSFIVAVLMGRPWDIAWSAPFVASLAYLSIVGSVLAFGAYFALLGRIGAARAAYIGVMTPIVALVVSTWLEGFQWRLPTVLGVGLALTGNALALRRATAVAPLESAREGR
jgi:drug/metabolite transporter (DMT)-like permease